MRVKAKACWNEPARGEYHRRLTRQLLERAMHLLALGAEDVHFVPRRPVSGGLVCWASACLGLPEFEPWHGWVLIDL